MRRALLVACVAIVSACAAAEAEPRATATLPVVEKAPPKTIYGVDPPVAAEATYAGGDQTLPPVVRASSCDYSGSATAFHGLVPQLRACYTKSLAADPDRNAKLVVHLRVDGAGRAASVSVDVASGARDATMEACVKAAFERASYPCSAGDVAVPLTFTH